MKRSITIAVLVLLRLALLPDWAAAADALPRLRPTTDPRWSQLLPAATLPLPKPPHAPQPGHTQEEMTPEVPTQKTLFPGLDAVVEPVPEMRVQDLLQYTPGHAFHFPAAESVVTRVRHFRWQVQLLAGRSLERVKEDQHVFVQRYGDLLHGRTLAISASHPQDQNDPGWYYLRVLDWKDRTSALHWCQRLRARGHPCLVRLSLTETAP